MAEEKTWQEFRLRNIDETRNYFMEEINRNELMTKKHKKICITLNYIEHFLILASLIGIPIGITSSAIGSKFVPQLQELKSISQWLRKRKRNMIK